jgi:dTDP-4-dehydrorhamnose reductase
VLGHERLRRAGIEPLRDWRAAVTEAFPEVLRAHQKENPA